MKIENYNRMVINLFKDAVRGNINSERVLEVNTAISNAITESRIQGSPTKELEAIKYDLLYLYELL